MIKNYFKLASRNIFRKKLYTIINLTGLGVASAFCILVYWYVKHEQSFDKFHIHANQLYRLEFNDIFGENNVETKKDFWSFLNPGADDKNLIATPVILAAELKKDFPEIENTVRIATGEAVVFVNNTGFKENSNVAFVDSSFFKVFSFPLKEGNTSTVLSSINNVVISEKIASKYFGKENAVGKTLRLSTLDNNLFTVTGVAKDFPVNSSFQFDLLFRREADISYKDDERHELNSFSDILILQLKKGTNITAFNQELDVFGKKYFQPTIQQWASYPGSSTVKAENFHIILRPFSNAHYSASSSWMHYTDLKKIYQLAALAVIILLIACLNYILLTLTSTISRSQEVGIRKTVGAERKQIILQFFIETQLLSFIAVIIGFLLSVICLPLFNYLAGTHLQLIYSSFKDAALSLLILSFILGILSGIYPALVMSGLKPLNMMRNFSAYRLNPYLSRILIVTQFSICIILIISSLVIRKQIRYTNTKDLGFDKEKIISIQNPYDFNDKIKTFQLRDRLFHYAAEEPAIDNITSTFFPYKGFNINNHVIGNEKVQVQDFNIDYNYFSFFKIPIIKGRSFSPSIVEDSAFLKLTPDQKMETGSVVRQSVVVNETLYKILGNPPMDVINRSLGGKIIGVCKDYYADDLTKKIAPAYHRIEKGYIGYFWIKIKAGQSIPLLLSKIKNKWNDLTANQPFTYAFLDEEVAKSYDVYLRWMKTISICSLLAIIIACMGLFGLSGLTTANRIKEIGIRKVLGATISDLFLMLNKSTLVIGLLSFVIAMPIAFYLMNEWLQNFAYHIQISWGVFAFAGILSTIMALIAVSYHTIKTAVSNPVKSLRTE